jgi:hypothetical protein
MISLTSMPERITNGETLIIKFVIQDKINLNTYKGSYFNLTLKKNGGTFGTITLYPLKFNGEPLEWEVNPYSYGSDGTFNVNCTLQNGPLISSTTFVVEPDCLVKNANNCNNITVYQQNKNLKESNVKKQVLEPEYVKSFMVQKQDQVKNSYEINHKEKEIEKLLTNNEFNSQLFSSVKVQRAYKNC